MLVEDAVGETSAKMIDVMLCTTYGVPKDVVELVTEAIYHAGFNKGYKSRQEDEVIEKANTPDAQGLLEGWKIAELVYRTKDYVAKVDENNNWSVTAKDNWETVAAQSGDDFVGSQDDAKHLADDLQSAADASKNLDKEAVSCL